MTKRWSIRLTRPTDRDAIVGVVREAFSTADRDAQEEVDIVLVTWSLEAAVLGLDLVAIEDDQVVGHVLGAYGGLDERRIVGVAPLTVAPHRQGKGIGSGLMNRLLRQAEEIGEPLLVLLGLPGYYSRFGFEPAGPLGIDCPSVGSDNPHFLIRKLETYSPDCRGEFRYCWELASGRSMVSERPPH
jgi:putative acetyltransferase